jgi:hypothetical protein
MALTRARKVLEYVIRDVYERRIKEPPGTRPLENLLQRLVKDGHFPDRLDAYANTIRKLGNVGTHTFGEKVTVADVYQSLTQLMPILEWYFEVERPEAAGAKPVQPQVPEPGKRNPIESTGPSEIKIIPKGLRSFDANDADFFLELLPGPRDRDGLPESIRFWKHRIEEKDEQTFTVGVIYGPSGCGKSSLVKAGLLPRLSGQILAVYVEATADDTDARLLKGLRKRCPNLRVDVDLTGTISALQQGQGLSQGQKVFIVLDQFEQWLHAKRGHENTELAQALRQCDGEHVQCVVMVRDDFWLAVSRFMGDLHIELLQGQNAALVDLFDPIHARNVLAAFGRAFGRLPDALSKEQETFLDNAVAGLTQDGKIISVHLALFAEMMKGKVWTPATLKEIGGMEGVGVTFLEETFSATTAPPKHRYHQKAARAVLKALLPDAGTDIMGHMRSQQELQEASGHASRPKDFADLIRILDSDRRLITPTDPEGKDNAGPTTVQAGAKYYYQLTHDYLVPALRLWLTRKQRQTWRGRAELRLAERATAWNFKPENRHLPAWWEWVNIRLLTRKNDWTAPERKLMKKAGRFHGLRAGILLLFLGLVGLGIHDVHGSLQAKARVKNLATAETVDVPKIIDDLGPYRRWAKPLLAEIIENKTDDSKDRLHAALALVQTTRSKCLFSLSACSAATLAQSSWP